MKVGVQFPDGAMPQVEALRRISLVPDLDMGTGIENEPAFDPDWVFQQIGETWVAHQRGP